MNHPDSRINSKLTCKTFSVSAFFGSIWPGIPATSVPLPSHVVVHAIPGVSSIPVFKKVCFPA